MSQEKNRENGSAHEHGPSPRTKKRTKNSPQEPTPHSEVLKEEGYALNRMDAFVREKLPSALAREPHALVALASAFAEPLALFLPRLRALKKHALSQALLNLKMLESSIVHSGLAAPRPLARVINELADGGSVPSLTYEDLVFTNHEPTVRYETHNGHTFGVLGAPYARTFTEGPVGETEAAFYRIHNEIEQHLGRVIACVEPLISPATKDVVGMARAHMKEIEGNLGKVLARTKELGEMPAGHFEKFRAFLTTHPERGYKGPSGAFTAKIPTLELMFRGDLLDERYRSYLRENTRYFPLVDRGKLAQAQGGSSLHERYLRLGKPKDLYRLLCVLDEFFREFRATHYRAVAYQVPEAIKGNAPGTGGEQHPGEFLRSRMRQHKPELPD